MPTVSVLELKGFFKQCNVAFDQLGHHWVGAGVFSMLSGRPLIANGWNDLYEKYIGERFPVCGATTSEEVTALLSEFNLNRQMIKDIGLASRSFILKHYSLEGNIQFYEEEIKKHFNSI